jgi:hypothetical protein
MSNEKKDSSKKTKKAPVKRITQAEMLLRKRNVAEWILDGNMPVDIVSSIQSKWGLKQRQAYYYIDGALELLEKNILGKLGERIAFHISVRLKLYKEVSEDKSLKSRERYTLMMDILKDIATIEGIYKHTIKLETEHTENYNFTLNLGDREQQEQIKERTIQLLPSSDNQLSEGDS